MTTSMDFRQAFGEAVHYRAKQLEEAGWQNFSSLMRQISTHIAVKVPDISDKAIAQAIKCFPRAAEDRKDLLKELTVIRQDVANRLTAA